VSNATIAPLCGAALIRPPDAFSGYVAHGSWPIAVQVLA
jgi:hypothetical protein